MSTNDLIFYIALMLFAFGVAYLMGRGQAQRPVKRKRFYTPPPPPQYYSKTTYYKPKEQKEKES